MFGREIGRVARQRRGRLGSRAGVVACAALALVACGSESASDAAGSSAGAGGAAASGGGGGASGNSPTGSGGSSQGGTSGAAGSASTGGVAGSGGGTSTSGGGDASGGASDGSAACPAGAMWPESGTFGQCQTDADCCRPDGVEGDMVCREHAGVGTFCTPADCVGMPCETLPREGGASILGECYSVILASYCRIPCLFGECPTGMECANEVCVWDL